MRRTVSRRTLPVEVAEKIGQAIVSGRLPPGASLPSEIELTRELGVSRTVLREALKLLSSKGLIASRPKSGTVVLHRHAWNTLDVDVLAWRLAQDPSIDLVNHWFAFRDQFEPFSARLAAERADAEALAKIDRAAREFTHNEVNLVESIEADIRLHQVILEASGNEFIVPLGRVLAGALRASFLLSTHRRGAREEALPLHQDVVDAIFAHDGMAAEAAMRRLIEVSRQDLLWVIAERNREQTGPSGAA